MELANARNDASSGPEPAKSIKVLVQLFNVVIKKEV